MRASHQLLPSFASTLESRVVLSHAASPAGALVDAVRPVRLSPAEIAASNASDASFPLGITDTIRSGLPIAEQLTITYNDGSTQTESLERVPDAANNTTTTYETINLRNNGGTEQVVDTVSYSGGTAPFSGDDNTHTITITLPDGATKTETYQAVITGRTTVITGTIHEAGGGIETWTSIQSKHGHKTTTNKTIIEPDGAIEHQKIVTTRWGKLDSTRYTTTILPDGKVRKSSSATDVIRVEPPSS